MGSTLLCTLDIMFILCGCRGVRLSLLLSSQWHSELTFLVLCFLPSPPISSFSSSFPGCWGSCCSSQSNCFRGRHCPNSSGTILSHLTAVNRGGRREMYFHSTQRLSLSLYLLLWISSMCRSVQPQCGQWADQWPLWTAAELRWEQHLHTYQWACVYIT